MRKRDHQNQISDDLRVWDGRRFILRNRYTSAPAQDGYLINRDPAGWLYRFAWSDFACFRAGPHLFWWSGRSERESLLRLMGKPEEYVYVGRDFFHGADCHVVSRRENWMILYISVTDGRLRSAGRGR